MARFAERDFSTIDHVVEPLLPVELGNGHLPLSALTPRQREVAGLVARGLPNAAIARQLVLTPGTVANHVASILQRLQLQSRTQIAAWAIEHGVRSGQDRFLATLEQLLEVPPVPLKMSMVQVTNLVADALGAEKVDVFLCDEATATLEAIGTSETPLGQKQRALGLDRQAIANGGRAAQVFLTGQVHFDGDVQQDKDELIGVRRQLSVRSQLAVPLEMENVRRGVITAQSTEPDFFAERDLLFLRAVGRWVASMAQRSELAERNAAAAVEAGRRLAAEELVTVLAHDLRNLLAPIQGRSEMLLRRARREADRANVNELVELRRAVDRLGRLVADLLDVARIDQGLFQLAPEPIDLTALVRESALALEVPGTPIEVAPTPEIRVVADPARIRQAVENLLANAVQHAPADSLVTVELSFDDVGREPLARVAIDDHGPGIDPELLPRLFERFARSSTSAGLGIGLYIARQIAEAHGGSVDATSTASGTRFTLCLPARPD